MTEAVRKGGTAMEDEGTISPENPVWVNLHAVWRHDGVAGTIDGKTR